MGPAARAAPSAEPFKTCARARARASVLDSVKVAFCLIAN